MDRFAELKAFTLVAAHGGFTAAARQLGLAPSSVTRMVDALEQRLGTPLLNRSTRTVTLTDAGRRYYERTQAILEQLEDADESVSAKDEAVQGLLRVSAPVTFSTLFIAPMLAQLGREHPGLKLELQLNDAVSNMVEEDIDVAIRIGAPAEQPNLIAHSLGGHRRVICASPDYLARCGTPQTPADLLQHNCLRFSYGSPGRRGWRLQREETVEEVAVSGNLSANNSEVLRRAVLDGAGIALLADWLVSEDLANGALVPLLTDFESNPGVMEIGVYAMYLENRRGSRRVRTFIEALQRRLPAAS